MMFFGTDAQTTALRMVPCSVLSIVMTSWIHKPSSLTSTLSKPGPEMGKEQNMEYRSRLFIHWPYLRNIRLLSAQNQWPYIRPPRITSRQILWWRLRIYHSAKHRFTEELWFWVDHYIMRREDIQYEYNGGSGKANFYYYMEYTTADNFTTSTAVWQMTYVVIARTNRLIQAAESGNLTDAADIRNDI